jgi:hypothetical protein
VVLDFDVIAVIISYWQVVPPTAHLVVSSASDFLLKWLLQYEHEHQQWSAAVSLGLIFNCFHPTDKKSKLQVVSGLFEVHDLALLDIRIYLLGLVFFFEKV